MVNVWEALVPHPPFANTEIVPPAVPIDGEILSVVEVPDQVPGKDQVYEVAPETGAL